MIRLYFSRKIIIKKKYVCQGYPYQKFSDLLPEIHLYLEFGLRMFMNEFLRLWPGNATITDRTHKPGPQIKVHNWKSFFLFLSQNICCVLQKFLNLQYLKGQKFRIANQPGANWQGMKWSSFKTSCGQPAVNLTDN